ncbi:hypothetical protein RNZ50_25990, partial [Paracoccaceae bacterium Fryx2]|nr:hypothetical protein [Paracoccaceae bacterium Fryx2]
TTVDRHGQTRQDGRVIGPGRIAAGGGAGGRALRPAAAEPTRPMDALAAIVDFRSRFGLRNLEREWR